MLKSLKITFFLILASMLALEYHGSNRPTEAISEIPGIIPAIAEGPQVTIEEGPFSISFDDVAEFIARDLKNRRIRRILVLDMYNQDNEATEYGIGLTLELFKGLAGHPEFNVSTAAPPPEARSEVLGRFDVDAIAAFAKSMDAEVVCAGVIHDDFGFLRFVLEVIDVNSAASIISVAMPLGDAEDDQSTRL